MGKVQRRRGLAAGWGSLVDWVTWLRGHLLPEGPRALGVESCTEAWLIGVKEVGGTWVLRFETPLVLAQVETHLRRGPDTVTDNPPRMGAHPHASLWRQLDPHGKRRQRLLLLLQSG